MNQKVIAAEARTLCGLLISQRLIEWKALMAWFRLATAIIVFLGSCVVLGYFAEYYAHRCKWHAWILGLTILAIAVLWPIVVVLYTIHDARNYHIQHPHDDAPGMVVASVIYVGAPFLFIASLPPTIAGVVIASRKKSERSNAA